MHISGNATIAAPAARARSMKPSIDSTLRSGLPARTSICASAIAGRPSGTAGVPRTGYGAQRAAG